MEQIPIIDIIPLLFAIANYLHYVSSSFFDILRFVCYFWLQYFFVCKLNSQLLYHNMEGPMQVYQNCKDFSSDSDLLANLPFYLF